MNGYTLDASLGEFILTHPNVSFFLFHRLTVGTHLKIDHRSPSRKNLFVQ